MLGSRIDEEQQKYPQRLDISRGKDCIWRNLDYGILMGIKAVEVNRTAAYGTETLPI